MKTEDNSIKQGVEVSDYIALQIAMGKITKDEFIEARKWVRDTFCPPSDAEGDLKSVLAAARHAGWCFARHADGVMRMQPLVAGEAQLPVSVAGSLLTTPLIPTPASPKKTGRDLYYDGMRAALNAPPWCELSDEDQDDWNAKAKEQA